VGWSVKSGCGSGGTSAVFVVASPNGEKALKILDEKYSTGALGEQSAKRIELEKSIGVHDCPYLVKVYDGGRFEDRLFVLMSKAPGTELEKILAKVPHSKIRGIVDQIAQACQFLRSHDICHRDIKSSNIFVSDDFNVATLLDLSVSRVIDDPIGMGTDHEGQLPVVATSRYSPPEYLFRLIDASPELWHALDIYQLGGLLHDLLMKEPMFEAQYKLSQDNRYRFAWIVATIDPEISSPEANQDLVLLARRALDKNYQRRGALHLEDFRNDAAIQRANGLIALGLGPRKSPTHEVFGKAQLLRRIIELSKSIEALLVDRLRGSGITATHEIRPGNQDSQKIIELRWDTPTTDQGLKLKDVNLLVVIALIAKDEAITASLTCELSAVVEGNSRKSSIVFPVVAEQADLDELLCSQILEALGDLARGVLQANER